MARASCDDAIGGGKRCTDVEALLRQAVIGQDQAVKQVALELRLIKAGSPIRARRPRSTLAYDAAGRQIAAKQWHVPWYDSSNRQFDALR